MGKWRCEGYSHPLRLCSFFGVKGGVVLCVEGMFIEEHATLALLWHLTAKHLKHQRGELHAMLRLEGQRAILLWVLFIQAAKVSELLDHLGIEEAPPRVVHPDVGLQDLWKMILKLFNMSVVLDTRTIWDKVNIQGEEQRRVRVLNDYKHVNSWLYSALVPPEHNTFNQPFTIF